MIKKITLLFLGLMAITHAFAQESETGSWQFEAIENAAGETLFTIDKALDSLVLENNRFHYR